MDITFIRHGHGEHLIDYPNQLNRLHPGLTEFGKTQVSALRTQIIFQPDDIIVVSPTKRTIETATLLTTKENILISPLVGPRMFPQNLEFTSLICDQIYSQDELRDEYTGMTTIELGFDCWENGINQLETHSFEAYANRLLQWCRGQAGNTYIISHDGTITNYRILLGESGLTRNDFLGEAGQYTISNF